MCRCKVGTCLKCSCVKKNIFCLDNCKCSDNCLSRPPKIIVTDSNSYEIEKYIGSGTFGTVFSLMNVDLVCKLSLSRSKIEKEFKLYKLLYPNLQVELIKKIQQGKKYYGFIMNKMIPFDYEKLSRSDLKKYLCDLIDILQLFHKIGYCHADIKPDNIMFYQNNIYLIDLNLTTLIGSKYDYVYGNYAYCSPRTQELKEFLPIDDYVGILFLAHKVLGKNKLKWGNSQEEKIKNKYKVLENFSEKNNEKNFSEKFLSEINIDLLKNIINSY